MDQNEMRVLARDATYTAIGFCVLGFQQLQLRRRQMAGDIGKGIGDRVTGVRLPGLSGLGGPNALIGKSALERLVRQAEAATDPVLNGVEKVLPGTARVAMQQSRTAAKILRRVIL